MRLATQEREPQNAVQSWNAELAFRSVVEATADKAGIDFLRHLVKNLSDALNVDYAFVAEFAGSSDRMRTVAFWNGRAADWEKNVEYPLAGTPCQQVVDGRQCLYHDHVQDLFPQDDGLVTLGVRSYLGVPLLGNQGQTLGHLAALHTEPMKEDPRGLAIFDVFATVPESRSNACMPRRCLSAPAAISRSSCSVHERISIRLSTIWISLMTSSRHYSRSISQPRGI